MTARNKTSVPETGPRWAVAGEAPGQGDTDLYRNVIGNMLSAFVYCRIVYDDEGNAVDIIHEEVNHAYEALTGLKHVVGRRLTEVIPDIAERNPEFFSRLLRTADTGNPERFVNYMPALDQWYDIAIYAPHPGFIVSIFDNITSKELTDRKLRESEERFSAIIKASGVGTWDWDMENCTVVLNERWYEIIGFTRTELDPVDMKKWRELVHPEEQEAFTVFFDRNARNEAEASELEYRMLHKNGQWVWVRDRGQVLSLGPEGQIMRMLGTHTDINLRKQAEATVKERELLFRSLFEDHSAAMLILDPANGRLVDANQAAAEFYGWSRSELQKMNITDINCAEAGFVLKDIKNWGNQVSRSLVARHQKADGSVRNVEIFAKQVNVKGRALIYDIIHDITERKRLESLAAMRARLLEMADTLSTEALLQLALDETEKMTESMIGFCFVIARDQTLISLQTVSTNTLKLMGAFSARNVHERVEQAGVWADAIRQRKTVIHNDYAALPNRKGLPRGHIPITRELVVPVIRGDMVVAAFGIGNKRSDYDEQDARWAGAVADLIWDIVEKKTTAQEYRNIEERLQHAQKMEMVGQLASGIAHEINNPLNFIQLNFSTLQDYFADLLHLLDSCHALLQAPELRRLPPNAETARLNRLEQELDPGTLIPELRTIFTESQRGIDRIRKIVEGMRSLSYRNAVDNLAPADLNQGIMDSLAMARSEYRFCADIVTHLAELPEVPCIIDQINQVLLNLIVNSAHAIQSQHRDEKGCITIRTWLDNARVFCSIADDGPGIPEEIRDNVFNPFYTTKSAGKGTGLGLSISYDIIVNRHSGQITLSCPPEGGAVFTFSLPLTDANNRNLSE